MRPAGHMQTVKLFLRPLSLEGLKIFCKMHPQTAILEENFEFLSQKVTFLKDIFGNSCDFHKFA